LFEKSEHKCSNYGIFVRRTNGRWNIGSDASERVGAREGEGKGRHLLTWEMAAGWQTFAQIASQFAPEDLSRGTPLFQRARESGLLRSDFVPTIQFTMLLSWCQIYLGYLPLYQRLLPDEDLASARRLVDARDYLVDFIVSGMMGSRPGTKPEKEC
jgi:hypothetical protein